MMDAVKFVKTLGRMCNAECIRCEFWKRRSSGESCTSWQKTHPEEAVAIVEQWAKEHPAKTRQNPPERVPEALPGGGTCARRYLNDMPDFDLCRV